MERSVGCAVETGCGVGKRVLIPYLPALFLGGGRFSARGGEEERLLRDGLFNNPVHHAGVGERNSEQLGSVLC